MGLTRRSGAWPRTNVIPVRLVWGESTKGVWNLSIAWRRHRVWSSRVLRSVR